MKSSLGNGVLALAVAVAAGCEGDTGPRGPKGPPGDSGIPTELARTESLPGMNVEILDVSGASGQGGNFRVGDRIKVEFTVKLDDGTTVPVDELDFAQIMVSGPTFNYQRVIAAQSDVRDRATEKSSGSLVYQFAQGIPAQYLPPLNDTATFDIGELQGQNLLAGTYTVGLEIFKNYTVGEDTFSDTGNATFDFLFGGATTLQPREVVTLANCNQCHAELRAHGNRRNNVTNCLLCHTAGSEDRNTASVASGTPDVTIDFKVMIHKIHAGLALPSVQGVTTDASGARDYTSEPPKPYQIIGFGDSLHDFSEVHFPMWPTLLSPMPRDTGYSALGSTERAQEDAVRSGPAECNSCHGDPDGSGPLTAPADGGLAFAQPSRMACASCHDDWDPDLPYTANMQTMPQQADDSACTLCHQVTGSSLDVMDAHRHPLVNTGLARGTTLTITKVAEAGTHDNDGTIDPGEEVAVTFTIEDRDGVPIAPADLSRFEAILSGPTENPNLVHFTSLPTAALTGSQPYKLRLPRRVMLEFVGDSTAAGGESFQTLEFPHWDGITGVETAVQVRTATGAGSGLLAAAPAYQNYIDVNPGDGMLFARDGYIVIDDGNAEEEYLRIQYVDGDRLWFSSQISSGYAPYLLFDHMAGASVDAVTLVTKVRNTDFMVTASTGTITELLEFGTGPVIVSYTTDFTMPTAYPGTINESPDLDESAGDWVGKSIVDGTYRLGLHASTTLSFSEQGEVTTYTEASPTSVVSFLVGNAMEIVPDETISSAANCYACHGDLALHGLGRRGFDGCILCHGVAGAEDRPPYVAGNAPDTTGLTIDFREMLHKIHHGAELANADTYGVIGFGSGYPNNFSVHQYGEVEFPVIPGGTQECTTCHGADNEAWREPPDRNHPTEQMFPVRAWKGACITCHDSDAAVAHADANTSPAGAESCAICHGPGKDEAVDVVHIAR